MKEAAGEANLTVVAIILIGVIVAVVTPIITGMMENTQKRACCMDSGGTWQGNDCQNAGSGYQACLDSAEASGN